MDRLARILSRTFHIEGLDAPENRTAFNWAMGIAGAGMLLRLIFWIYTQRYWEDSLITCLHSENFAEGFGLTHVRPGEPPLHGFTSPLSVLIPLLGDLMHVGFGVELLKIASMPASALTVLFILGICIHPAVRLPLPLGVMVMGYAAFEHHQILWGMAGMETQVACLVVIGVIYHTVAWHPKTLGLWLGLCMLGRPDFAFLCAIVGFYGLFKDWRSLPWVVGIAVAVYAPWIVFTFLHYGSPMPNTIVAKNSGYHHWDDRVQNYSIELLRTRFWNVMKGRLLPFMGPTFAGHGGAGVHTFWIVNGFSPVGAALAVFIPLGFAGLAIGRRYALWPLAACVIAYTIYFSYFVPLLFGWYKVPYMLTLLLIAVWGLHLFTRIIPGSNLRLGFQWALSLAYVASFVGVLPLTFYAEHQIQWLVEENTRKAGGIWLNQNMKKDEAVACEPLGYIGYYSRGNVYDWPGLDSRQVVNWSLSQPKNKRSLENMIQALQPEYLFLRDLQMQRVFRRPEWIVRHYHPVATFLVSEEDKMKIPWVGRNIDLAFRIYKKNRDGDPPTDHKLWPRKFSAAKSRPKPEILKEQPPRPVLTNSPTNYPKK